MVLKLLVIFQTSFKDAILFYMNLLRATRGVSKNELFTTHRWESVF